MDTTPTPSASVSKKVLRTGYIMSTVPVLFLLMSGGMKLFRPPMVIEGFKHLGLPENLILAIGVLELTCTVIYIIPRTSVLGAILLTGYLGGAILTHLRVGEAFIFQFLFGVLVWGGLFLRDRRLRELIPLRRCACSSSSSGT